LWQFILLRREHAEEGFNNEERREREGGQLSQVVVLG
jgi:hypothetical protein